jgi:hypothetical protein
MRTGINKYRRISVMVRKLVTAALTATFVFAVFWAFEPRAEAQGGVEILEGNIKKKKLKRNKQYLLRGGVFITKKLVIQSGTQIFGQRGSFLVIDEGARIEANGTRDRPIVFTSDQPAPFKRRGDWGGLIFNGNAPINVPGGTAEGEGDTGEYGGNNAADGAGNIIRFVRVEYGGFPISPENELNCIAFQGTGSGMDIDFIAAAFGGDDGMEWFGGATNVKHAVVVGASDDSLDWTFGWSGKVQFAVIQQRADEADAGIEADNNENNFDFTPRSHPKIMNMTLVGAPGQGPGSTRGILLRRGTAADIRNFIVTGFKNVGLEVRDDPTFTQLNADMLTLRGAIFFNNGGALANPPVNTSGATATAVGDKGVKILNQVDPQLRNPFSTTAPDFRPQAGSPAVDAANAEPPFANDSFFLAANYVGAFDANDDWTLGWVNYVFGN